MICPCPPALARNGSPVVLSMLVIGLFVNCLGAYHIRSEEVGNLKFKILNLFQSGKSFPASIAQHNEKIYIQKLDVIYVLKSPAGLIVWYSKVQLEQIICVVDRFCKSKYDENQLKKSFIFMDIPGLYQLPELFYHKCTLQQTSDCWFFID